MTRETIRELRRLVAQTDSIYVLIDMNYLLTGARQLVHFTRITVDSYFAGPRLTYISIGLNYSRQHIFTLSESTQVEKYTHLNI